jgi:hypothetical protein
MLSKLLIKKILIKFLCEESVSNFFDMRIGWNSCNGFRWIGLQFRTIKCMALCKKYPNQHFQMEIVRSHTKIHVLATIQHST